MSILGRTKASRLVASLRERQGLVSSITSSLSAMEGVGLVMITAQLEPEHLARAESEILAEIQRVRDDGVTPVELKRAITAAEVDHEFSTETAEGRARACGQAETIWRLEEELAVRRACAVGDCGSGAVGGPALSRSRALRARRARAAGR